MDDIVLKGMAKWPNVPAVYGWLALDRRGAWLLKGEKIFNPAVIGFIGRNYEHDNCGRWFFQNGPQRVYVTLEYTPRVYRVLGFPEGRIELESHDGRRASGANGAWIDEEGTVLIETRLGIGIVHDKDLPSMLNALVDCDGHPLDEDTLESRIGIPDHQRSGLYLKGLGALLPLNAIRSEDVAKRFAFDPNPSETPAHDLRHEH